MTRPTARPYWSLESNLTLTVLPSTFSLTKSLAASPSGCALLPKCAVSGASTAQSRIFNVPSGADRRSGKCRTRKLSPSVTFTTVARKVTFSRNALAGTSSTEPYLSFFFEGERPRRIPRKEHHICRSPVETGADENARAEKSASNQN